MDIKSSQKIQKNRRKLPNEVRKSRKLPKAVRPEDFKTLIKIMPKKDIRTKIAFLLAYGSGLRISEVIRLKPDNINGTIFIEESKYGVERIVPVPKGWRDEFKKYLPFRYSNDKSGIRTLQKKFLRYKEKAGLNPKYTFHSLRHGFATRCIENGVPLNQLQVLLGHANIATTSVYVKANPKDAIKSYEELF